MNLSRAPDLITRYLDAHGECWLEWEGSCADLADAAMQWWESKSVRTHLIWIEPFLVFKYHAALVHRGRIHDSYHGSPLLISNYFRKYNDGQLMIADHVIDTDFVLRQKWQGGKLLSQAIASFEEDDMQFKLEARDLVGRCTHTITQIDLMGYTLGTVELDDKLNISAEDRVLLGRAKDQILALRETLDKLRNRGMPIFAKDITKPQGG